jgi:heat shock protein HtpX
MRQRSFGRDTGLTLRIAFTMMMLATVWVFFMGLLFWAGIPWVFILVFAIIGTVMQYFGSDKLMLLSTRARAVSAQEEPKLHATVERLAQMADMRKPKKIAIMETHVPNAFATGRNPKNAVLAVSRGLLSRLTEPEVEAVLGHELTHIKNRDVAVMTWRA